jgi:hypothetical protein
MFPCTSCRNPLCPIPHKVFRNHAAYSRHLNCSTGCLHYIRSEASATANQCHPPSSHVVTTSTKSPALLRSQFVNGDTTVRAEPKQPRSSMDNDHSFHDDTSRTDDDLHGFALDDASDIRPVATPNHQAFVNTPHASQTFAYPGFTHTVDQKWTAALLKVMDDINAPDYAFGLILAWARGARAEEYSFHPQGGLDRARNVTVLVKSIANATQLLPSVHSVSSPHGPPCDVVVFDFVPQLLRLLQNPTLMIPENVVLDF